MTDRYYQDMDVGEYRQLSSKCVRAAKQHTCEMCGGVIPRNTYYYRTVNLYDGKIYTVKSHAGASTECLSREYESDPADPNQQRGAD